MMASFTPKIIIDDEHIINPSRLIAMFGLAVSLRDILFELSGIKILSDEDIGLILRADDGEEIHRVTRFDESTRDIFLSSNAVQTIIGTPERFRNIFKILWDFREKLISKVPTVASVLKDIDINDFRKPLETTVDVSSSEGPRLLPSFFGSDFPDVFIHNQNSTIIKTVTLAKIFKEIPGNFSKDFPIWRGGNSPTPNNNESTLNSFAILEIIDELDKLINASDEEFAEFLEGPFVQPVTSNITAFTSTSVLKSAGASLGKSMIGAANFAFQTRWRIIDGASSTISRSSIRVSNLPGLRFIKGNLTFAASAEGDQRSEVFLLAKNTIGETVFEINAEGNMSVTLEDIPTDADRLFFGGLGFSEINIDPIFIPSPYIVNPFLETFVVEDALFPPTKALIARVRAVSISSSSASIGGVISV